MANTEWYDKNHSNDPSALQGRDSDGKFTTDTMGGHGASTINNFFRKSVNEITIQDKEVLEDLDDDELMYWLRAADLEDGIVDEADTAEHDELDNEYNNLFNTIPSMSMLSSVYKNKLKKGFKEGNIESKRFALRLIKEKALRYEKRSGSNYLVRNNSKTISIVDDSNHDLGDTYWHEHWHALDHLMFNNSVAKEEFNEEVKTFQGNIDNIFMEYKNLLEKQQQEAVISKFGQEIEYEEVINSVRAYADVVRNNKDILMSMLGSRRIMSEIMDNPNKIYGALERIGLDDEALKSAKAYLDVKTRYQEQYAIKEKIRYEYSCISDFFNGASNQKYDLGYGHGGDYWRRDSDNLRKELIANIGATLSVNRPSTSNRVMREFISKYFPKTMERMRKILIQEGK